MWDLVVRVLHFVLVLYIILVPFFGPKSFLELHAIIIPFIMIHWALNDSTCFLTELEKKFTNKTSDGETFIGRLVSPVYTFKTKGDESVFIWAAMFGLWALTIHKLGKFPSIY
jgi:hypothetical protein